MKDTDMNNLPSMAPCIHGNVPHDCSNCQANERILQLEAENRKLHLNVIDLQTRLNRTFRSLNRRIRDDYETVDFGDYRI